jgi:hypothetical protein
LRHGVLDFGSSSPEGNDCCGESREQYQAADEHRQALSQIAVLALSIIDAQRGEIMLGRV